MHARAGRHGLGVHRRRDRRDERRRARCSGSRSGRAVPDRRTTRTWLTRGRPKRVGERLVNAVRKHADGRPQNDDIAVVCFGRLESDHGADQSGAARSRCPARRCRLPSDEAQWSPEAEHAMSTTDAARNRRRTGTADEAAAAVQRHPAQRRRPHLRVRHRDAQGAVRPPDREGLPDWPRRWTRRAGRSSARRAWSGPS